MSIYLTSVVYSTLIKTQNIERNAMLRALLAKIQPIFNTVTIGNQKYKTVIIGDQEWLVENLNVEHYRNGDLIPEVQDNGEWTKLNTGAWCYYDNNPENSKIYGKLYNWYAVNDPRRLAPIGWHVPTADEWMQLELYLGMKQTMADQYGERGTDEGGKLKEAGTEHWISPNTGATNARGFTAQPGGWRSRNCGNFYWMCYCADFWSASEACTLSAWARNLHYDSPRVSRYNPGKRNGFSVRLLRD